MDRRLKTMGLPALTLTGLALLGGGFGPAEAQAQLVQTRKPGAVTAPVAPAPQGSTIVQKVKGPTADSAVVDFHTKIGSFKILSNSAEVKARGKLELEFQGTVLIIGLEGNAVPAGAVKVQYDDPAHARTAYFGRGRLTVDGKWRAIQFFGRDLKGTWDGMGFMRMFGEFDDKLDTGTYQIRGFGTKEAWGNGGRTIILPPPTNAPRVKPKIVDVPTNPKLPG